MNKIFLLLTILHVHSSLRSQAKMEVEGAIVIENSTASTHQAGTIRWSGSDFEGWNGYRWISLTHYATVGSLTDIDGNTYQTTRIGNQEWMEENLQVTKYSDNALIPQITENSTWSALTTGTWCWYNNDNSFENPYSSTTGIQ